MDKAAEYRKRADAVERMADAVASEAERENLAAIARTWRGLAERAEIAAEITQLAVRWRGLMH